MIFGESSLWRLKKKKGVGRKLLLLLLIIITIIVSSIYNSSAGPMTINQKLSLIHNKKWCTPNMQTRWATSWYCWPVSVWWSNYGTEGIQRPTWEDWAIYSLQVMSILQCATCWKVIWTPPCTGDRKPSSQYSWGLYHSYWQTYKC